MEENAKKEEGGNKKVFQSVMLQNREEEAPAVPLK